MPATELTLRALAQTDLDALQALVERCREYYLLASRRDPDAGTAWRIWQTAAPGVARDAKLALGLFDDAGAGRLVAFADVVPGWPRAGTWLVALLLVDPAVRRRGAGTRLVAAVDGAAAQAGAQRVRISVLPVNAGALAFWEGIGFEHVAARDASLLALERHVGA